MSAARYSDPETVRCETFGRPLEGVEIRIIDSETRKPLPRGETGEILVKSPTMMEGYYKVPRSATFDAEGFFRTGDRGYFDEDGCLHFGGRLKDVIKTAGVNVAAAEVEEALARHPSVKNAYVVGVPDPARGENVAAFIVLGADGSADAEAIRAFCREGLASYKVPRHVFFIGQDEVPRTGTGKIEKAALREAAISRISGG